VHQDPQIHLVDQLGHIDGGLLDLRQTRLEVPGEPGWCGWLELGGALGVARFIISAGLPGKWVSFKV